MPIFLKRKHSFLSVHHHNIKMERDKTIRLSDRLMSDSDLFALPVAQLDSHNTYVNTTERRGAQMGMTV